MADRINVYEAMFLLGPSGVIEPEAAQTLCRQTIERHGGQIIVLKKWDERKLAYEIEGQKRGTYIIAYFRAPAVAITPLEREVKLSEQILRVMVTRADHLNEQEMAAVEPQPIQPKEEKPWDRPMDFGDRPPRERRPRREESAEKPEAAAPVQE